MTDPIFKGTDEQLTNAAEEMIRRARTNSEKAVLRALLDARERAEEEIEAAAAIIATERAEVLRLRESRELELLEVKTMKNEHDDRDALGRWFHKYWPALLFVALVAFAAMMAP